MLRTYLPALVFVLLGAGVGVFFTLVNAWLGPRTRRSHVRRSPYECGMPSTPGRGRFVVSFYLVALMFLIFDLEVVLLFPTSIVLRDLGVHGLLSIGLFISLLGIEIGRAH